MKLEISRNLPHVSETLCNAYEVSRLMVVHSTVGARQFNSSQTAHLQNVLSFLARPYQTA